MISARVPIILASSSAIRRSILEQADVPFTHQSPRFDEEAEKPKIAHLSPKDQALHLAKQKALSISRLHPSAYVIGADQICLLEDGQIMGKPGNFERAFQQLKLLSGRKHQQISGLVIAHNGEIVWEHIACADIQMRPLLDEEIKQYLALDQPFDACGSYQLESHASHLFKHVNGTDSNILGLPLVPLLAFFYDQAILQFSTSD